MYNDGAYNTVLSITYTIAQRVGREIFGAPTSIYCVHIVKKRSLIRVRLGIVTRKTVLLNWRFILIRKRNVYISILVADD